MSDLRIYLIMRNGDPIAAFSSPVLASMYLMREPSGLRLKSIVVQDMLATPLHTAKPTEDANADHQ